MNRQTNRLATLVVACAILLLVPAGAVSIGMIPSAVTVDKGATTEISLVLDDAPSGLAGYDLVVRFSNSPVAEISKVTYPAWAALNNTTRRTDGSVRISGVDRSRQVGPGATAVPLATLTLRGISGGSSSISLESVNMDADGGDLITPDVPNGQITVLGGTGPVPDSYFINASSGSGGVIVPSGLIEVTRGSNMTFTFTPNAGYTVQNVMVDDDGKGALGTYTFSTVTANHTISVSFRLTSSGGGGGGGGGSVASVTTSPTSPSVTSLPMVTTTTSIATPASQETFQVPVTTQVSDPEQTSPAPTAGIPGSVGGIPWAWVLGGIIVIGALVVVAFIAWRKEQEQG